MFDAISVPGTLTQSSVGAYYLRLSTAEQGRAIADPLGRQKFSLDSSVGARLGTPPEEHLYIDLQSGRKDQREHLQRLLTAIQSGAVQWVGCYRVDRIGRDIQHNLRLWDIFTESGCELFIFEWGRFVDFQLVQSDEDRDRFIRDSVIAEKESRIRSRRSRSAHEYTRHLGKANYNTPYGYIRTPEGETLLDPDPEVQKIVAARRDIYLETGSFRETSRRLALEYNHGVTSTGLSLWLFNPVLQGHTPRKLNLKVTSPVSRFGTPDFNTHPDQVVISPEQLQQIHELYRRGGGGRKISADQNIAPVAGLCQCAVCGFHLTSVSWQNKKKGLMQKLVCHGYRGKDPRSSCSKLPRKKGIYIELQVIEDALIEALAKRANEIAQIICEPVSEQPPSAEELKVQDQIVRLEQLQKEIPGSDFSLEITKLKAQIQRPGPKHLNYDLHDQLRNLFSSTEKGSFLRVLPVEARRDIYHRFTEKIIIDKTVVVDIVLRV